MQLRPYQQEAVDAAIEWMRKRVEPGLLELATGCHTKGHPILMHDGTIKNVEDIVVGDKVMGPDSSPRTVVDLHRGRESMFRVKPKKGEPFVVNAGHILSLYVTPIKKGGAPSYIELSVREWINSNRTKKHITKLEYVPVEFSKKDNPVPPWVVGFMIGDGCQLVKTPSFTNPDIEAIEKMREWAESIGCRLSEHKRQGTECRTYSIVDPISSRVTESRAYSLLESIGIYWLHSRDKFVPEPYKTSSKEDRLEMIAGLLDSDGHLSNSGYDWISKSEKLADDLVFLCRSVGLSAYKAACIKGCQTGVVGEYYRVSISGDCSIIPCVVSRKKAQPRRQIKNNLVTGFSVEEIGEGEYFGFELDGDHLYLDGNFIRHHNSGKSFIVAAIARWVHEHSGKKVLCLQPSKELLEQNHEKYEITGERAGVFSASAGRKEMRFPVVYATPGSVRNSIARFGEQFAAVIIDEAHYVTNTITGIISSIRKHNPKLRVIGLTATPYRTGSGYIYQYDEAGKFVDEARDPYYNTLLYRITARELIDMGFLTPVHSDPAGAQQYSAGNLPLNNRGQFNTQDLVNTFEGKNELTHSIIQDVIMHSVGHGSVMIFAATVQHAKEILAYLPPGEARMIGGDINTAKKDREALVRDFKNQKFKYVVSVAILTTGFDAPAVSLIAILRATESPGLLQQIIGRGLRLSPGKTECVVLDYAENIERHGLHDDLLEPEIRMSKEAGEAEKMEADCPTCGFENLFSVRPEYEGMPRDSAGYLMGADGLVVETDDGPIPVHFGRRCTGQIHIGDGRLARCEYRWNGKECIECQHMNDIAARYCEACKEQLVSPDEKLRLEFIRVKKDPYSVSTDAILEWSVAPSISRAGNKTLRVEYKTKWRSFTIWYMPTKRTEWALFSSAVFDGRIAPDIDAFMTYLHKGKRPETITYHRVRGSDFYNVLGYNRAEDEIK